MRKITLTLMSLFLSMGAMAQFEAGKFYRIKEIGTGLYLSVGGTAQNSYGEVYGAQGNKNDNRQIFMFEQLDNGNYLVKSNSGEYISYQGTGAGWNVNADPSRENAHELTFESVDTDEFNNDFKIKCYNTSKRSNKYFKWEKVDASGKYHPFNDDATGAVFVVEKVDYTPNHTGAKTRTNRLVGSISVANDTYTMPSGTEATRNSYTDLTATKIFTVQAGSEVALAMTQSAGTWMNAFVYVDMDKNDFFEAGIANDNYTPTGDLVSYSFYNQGYNNDKNGRNSAGTPISDGNRSTLTLPNWTVPADLAPGEYRIRFKYDWCNINPYGDIGTYFDNTFTGHGGEIIDFTLKVVKPHTLAVTNAGWATLYLDFPAAIPENVDAYIVTGLKKDNWLNLVEVEDVIPANTGVLVNANQGNYTFNYAATATEKVDGNLLCGSVVNTPIKGSGWVLGYDVNDTEKKEVVFAQAVLNRNENGEKGNTHFMNNANKAYLPATSVAGAALSASLRFDFGGTTAIEEVETENAETVIYDLTGRRVNEITKAGVYIVNGRKILVK